jgi:hypothetical protein
MQKGLAKLLLLQQAHFGEIREAVKEASKSTPLKQCFDFMAQAMEKAELLGLQLFLHHGNRDIYRRILGTFIAALDFPKAVQASDIRKPFMSRKKKPLLHRGKRIRPVRNQAPEPVVPESGLETESEKPAEGPSPVEMNALLYLLSLMQHHPDFFMQQ